MINAQAPTKVLVEKWFYSLIGVLCTYVRVRMYVWTDTITRNN